MTTIGRLLLLTLITFIVISCAHHQPYEPAKIDDIPPGPGLLTGEEGEWILYKR